MAKYEIEHPHKSMRDRKKVLEGKESSHWGGCLMTFGCILGIGLIIWLYFIKNLNLKTSLIIGGIFGGILIVIGFFKKISGGITQDEGYDEEWIEEKAKSKKDTKRLL